MQKTSEALFEAMEAIARLKDAMCWDVGDSDTKPKGAKWLKNHYPVVTRAYTLLEETRDSLNDDGGKEVKL